jgi:uncharacterized protein (TIGR02246 family)
MLNDEQSIRGIVERLEQAWNHSDSTAFAEVFAEDADFVDILGRHHRGRATIEAGHRQIFDTIYRGSRNTSTVEWVRFLRRDIAVVFLRAELLSRLGGAVDQARRAAQVSEHPATAQARPTLILSNNGRGWEIVAFQNTRIAEGIGVDTI